MKRIDVSTNEVIALLYNAMSDMEALLSGMAQRAAIYSSDFTTEAGQIKVTPEDCTNLTASAKRIADLTTLLVEE